MKLLSPQHTRQPRYTHRKKRLAIFPSPAGMSITKLSLVAENNLIIPDQEEFGYSDIPFGVRKIANLFLQCSALKKNNAWKLNIFLFFKGISYEIF
jgi:hypothetical protein